VTYTAVRLLDPDSGYQVAMMPADGVSAQVLDVGVSARAAMEDRVTARGAYDVTRYLSAAVVSLQLLLYHGVTQTPELFWDSLTPLLDPALRPWLIVSNDQWPTDRQMTVRYDNVTKPFSDPTNWPVQIQWVSPTAVWEDTVQTSGTLLAIVPSTSGLEFDPTTGLVVTSAGYVFPQSTQAGPAQITSIGNTVSDWQALMYGPCVGPRLANDATGFSLNFTPDLVLSAGDYVLLDSSTQTAYKNSDTASPVTSHLDFPSSNWWLMQPGLNLLRYWPASAQSGSLAQVNFRPAWFA
jgi:hypothetical protein